MDTFFCDEPAGDDSVPGHANCMMIQLFHGLDYSYYAGYPMRSGSQEPEVYEGHICKVGAPIGIMSNNAKAQLHGSSTGSNSSTYLCHPTDVYPTDTDKHQVTYQASLHDT